MHSPCVIGNHSLNREIHLSRIIWVLCTTTEKGDPQNYKTIVKRSSLATEQGCANAQTVLGVVYIMVVKLRDGEF